MKIIKNSEIAITERIISKNILTPLLSWDDYTWLMVYKHPTIPTKIPAIKLTAKNQLAALNNNIITFCLQKINALD